ncbi:MAG: hypothetical protein ACR2GT_11595 [Gaiellaceae bacterium]
MTDEQSDFEPWPILAALELHGVEYVVIGGIAAVIRGVPFVTRDLDVSPRRDRDNLDRLAAALLELEATPKIVGRPNGLDVPLEGAMIAGFANLSLDTPHGQLDLVLLPDGTRGYDDLVRSATRIEVDASLSVLVAALADVIRSKAAAGRPKDQAQLPILRETLEQSRREP